MANKNGDIAIINDNLPFKTEARCNICQSKSRAKVDKLLAAQFSWISIAEELIMSDDDFKGKKLDTVRRNVERHSKLHIDIKNKAIRRIVEKRAEEQGMLLDSVEGKITSGRALLDLLISQATQQLSDPSARVKYADAIEAVKLLEDVQKAEFQSQLEVLQRQVWAVSTAVKEKVPEPLLPGIVERAHQLFESGNVAGELEKAK